MAKQAEVSDIRREPLTRERIVATAVAIGDERGLEALSMRHVAAELNATPMALYNHFANKDELLAAISTRLLQEIDLSAIDPTDWAGSIKTGYSEFRRVLLRHPNLIPVLQRKADVSPDALRPIEVALTLLRSGGLSPDEAIRAHWTLTGFTMGHVVWQLMSPLFDEAGASSLAAKHKHELPEDEFPCLLESMPALEECDMDAAWDFGIDTIIQGLKAQMAASKTP